MVTDLTYCPVSSGGNIIADFILNVVCYDVNLGSIIVSAWIIAVLGFIFYDKYL